MSLNKKVVWLPYDFDTAIGINNSGLLAFSYNLQDIDTQQGGEFIFNGQDSVMWTNLRDAFGPELKSMYQNLRSTGAISYNKVEKMFEDHQEKWSEAIFNEDAYFKYIEPLTNPAAGELPDASYLPMAQGSKAEQRKWWLYNRFRYMDSKYNAGDALTDYIMMRAYSVDDITITPYADIYLTTAWDGQLTQVRAHRGQSYVLACPKDSANDAVVAIYSASQLASVGDLSGLKIKSGNFSMATRLQQLKIGDSDFNYSNTNLIDLQLGNNTLLKKLDVRNCPNLAITVNLQGCKNIEEVYFDGTSIAGVVLPNGGILKKLYLPDSVTNLTVLNQPNISEFVMDDYSNISTLRLENCGDIMGDDAMNIVKDMDSGGRVRLIGIDWETNSINEFKTVINKLNGERGIDENGNNVNIAQLSGLIHATVAPRGMLTAATLRYPYVTFTADDITNLIREYLTDKTQTTFEDNLLTAIRGYAFYNFTSLTSVSSTSVTTIGNSAFYNCTNLEEVSMENVTRVSDSAFEQCRKLKYASFPKATMSAKAFKNCNDLEWADIRDGLGGEAFMSCYIMKYLFLRSTSQVGIIYSSVFTNTPISGYNSQVGTVFVPSNLISTYQTATYWSNWYNNNTVVFKALENYTLDGTITGAINWTKIRSEEVSS